MICCSYKHLLFVPALQLCSANYYRLRTMDLDGTYTLSGTKVLNFDRKTPIAAFPNPLKDFVNVTGAVNGSTLQLLDATSKLVKQQIATGTMDNIGTNGLVHLPTAGNRHRWCCDHSEAR